MFEQLMPSHVKTYCIYFGCSSAKEKNLENQTSLLRSTNPKTANSSEQIHWNLCLLELGISGRSAGIRKESRMFGDSSRDYKDVETLWTEGQLQRAGLD